MTYILDTTSRDSYQELYCPGTRRVTLQISNAAVLIGFGQGHGAALYGPDEPFLPIVGSVLRDCDAIRVRSYTPGTPAQVKIAANP